MPDTAAGRQYGAVTSDGAAAGSQALVVSGRQLLGINLHHKIWGDVVRDLESSGGFDGFEHARNVKVGLKSEKAKKGKAAHK